MSDPKYVLGDVAYERRIIELEQERDRYRQALKVIAWNDSGWCGNKARETLHPQAVAATKEVDRVPVIKRNCDCSAGYGERHAHDCASRLPMCGRLLVGQGTDTWDPLCVLPTGHKGVCRPDAR